MTLIRRLILALALMAGLAPAFAAAPPPVPALPDAERRTSYNISASTCNCSVGFALYGDGTDVGNWIEVFVNGVLVSNYTITSPTGSLASIPRPITDAVLTFNTAQTGTVQIVGARRPRRVSQFSENQGVAARDFNQALTDIIAQNREEWDFRARALQGVPGDNFAPFPAASVRSSTLLGFDASGNLAYLPLGPTVSVSAGSVFNTQGLAQAASISVTVQFVQTAGYAATGDGGWALYSKAGGSTPCGFQSADGQWWTPDFSRGFNIRVCGAGLGNGAADVAAMTAASQALGPTVQGLSTGVNIIIPAGNYDFSTGSFLFTQDGTRILCAGGRTAAIKFNPAAPASLFTFFRSGDANGIGNSEMSDCRIYSTNSVQKTIITLSNSSGFIMRRNVMTGITGGNSIAILYQGRNWFIYEDNFITADFPFFFNTNPDRALAGNEDADFTTGARNQLATGLTNGAIYTVQTGLNITNWSVKDEDWAGGHRGVDDVDTTASVNSQTWTFDRVRREQETGATPTMFVIRRSAGILRDFRVTSPSIALGALADLTGIERAEFVSPFFNAGGVNTITADATVAELKWSNLFAQSNNTVALTGQTLIRAHEQMGGTTIAPIYRDAVYTNTPQGAVEWMGAPSANGRRVGLWRLVADVPVHSGSNDLILLPWTLYTVQYATIRVSSPAISGIATFQIGQVAPGGVASLVGQTNFAVDGGSGHLSVFHFSDSSVGIVNKLAGSVPVTVEVLFTE